MSRKQENICSISQYGTSPFLQCKDGHTCNGWDRKDRDESNNDESSDNDDSSDDKDDFENDELFDYIGKIVKHGEIKHINGLCVDMDDTDKKLAVLTSAGCSRNFCFTEKGFILDKTTMLCLNDGVIRDDEKKLEFTKCSCSRQWEESGKGFHIKGFKDLCWHSHHGTLGHQDAVTCKTDSSIFKFSQNSCWETKCGFRFKNPLTRLDKYKFDCPRELEDAKDACLENISCTGIHIKQGVCTLNEDEKPCPSAKGSEEKALIRIACDISCDLGAQRCPDGQCKAKCSSGDEDDDCSPGITLCPDGICRHVHMC